MQRSSAARKGAFVHRTAYAGTVLGPNLLSSPNSPAAGGWATENLTYTAGQTDPLGGTTATLATDNAVNAAHRFFQQSTVLVNGQKYQITAYIKAGTFTGGATISNVSGASLNLDTVNGICIAGGTMLTAQATNVGNGWFRYTGTYINTNGTTDFYIVNFATTAAYVGTGQTQVFWGMAWQTST